MTDTMSAREQIRAVLEEAARVPSEMKLHGDEHVDRIIDIVREALMSDDAVDAVDGTWKFPTKGMERMNRMRLTAALDAAFGNGAGDE